MSRESKAASTFSIHSAYCRSINFLSECLCNNKISTSESTSPAVQTSFALHSGLSWEHGNAPHDLVEHLAMVVEEEQWEEQEEMQTEEHGEVEQEERQEERAFRQHEAQKNLRRRQVSCSPFES